MRCALLAVVLAAALAVGQSRRPSFAPGLELKAMPKARAEPNLSAALLRTRGGEAVEAATSAAGPVASGILGRFASLDLFTTKILLAAGLAMLNVLCWAVPLRANAFSGNAEALSFANCFSGGIFLALSLGHLIPEVRKVLLNQAVASTPTPTPGLGPSPDPKLPTKSHATQASRCNPEPA